MVAVLFTHETGHQYSSKPVMLVAFVVVIVDVRMIVVGKMISTISINDSW